MSAEAGSIQVKRGDVSSLSSSAKSDQLSGVGSTLSNIAVVDDGKEKKLKPCCACPETRASRDTCIIENGEENCLSEIENHKRCMRDLGFNI